MNSQPPGEARTVLVCDYVGRRSEAPISSLDLSAHGYVVRDLITAPYSTSVTATGYAGDLLGHGGPATGDVLAVLAYCASAPIAQEVVRSLAATTGRRIPLVIFDGEQSTAESIRQQFALAVANLGDVLELPTHEHPPAPVWDEQMLREQPAEVLRRLHDGLLALGARAVEIGAGDPEVAQEDAEAIAAYYLNWFAHLLASHNAVWPAWDGPTVPIVSRDHPVPAGAGEPIRIDVDRDNLLRHPETAEAVLGILQNGVHRAT
jgi:hypothetical protein